MGTNFYWFDAWFFVEPGPETAPLVRACKEHFGDVTVTTDVINHIGKRSAAGLYCWDCGVTNNPYGTQNVHHRPPEVMRRLIGGDDHPSHRLSHCPMCGKAFVLPEKAHNTGLQELGFDQELSPRSGISSCCSFTWTSLIHKRRLQELSVSHPEAEVVVDEYGDRFTAQAFLEEELGWVAMEFQCCSDFS